MQKGEINVQTGNIFPIIKKFLYSEHEIFLRELVSNAVDATTKLKKLVAIGKADVELGDLTIKIELDSKKKTLKISDRGIGMTEEEVQKYINEIAFSGAGDFVNKYIGKDETEINGIIGHFGLGFYSAFMVADKVEIKTLSYLNNAKAVKWSCDGSPEYTMNDAKKADRGTEITLHFADDAMEFNDEFKILDLLKKYCRFLPYPIEFGVEKSSEPIEGESDDNGKPKYREIEKPRIINNVDPIWKKSPSEQTEEDYAAFYRQLYPFSFEEPLFHIHINVDYPFNLTGILYFPRLKKNIEIQKNKIQLYCNQVFVTDNVENIVPDFLTLLHGVIDSPDIPLNVSRSYLQSDSNVKKISSHITKKVADKLEELFKTNREEFEKKWDDIRVFIRYGMITNESFAERAAKFALVKDTLGAYHTFDEYRDAIKENQTDKDKQLVLLYTTDKEEQHAFISAATAKGYSVLELDSVIDIHFIDALERKYEKTSFKRVDADTTDKLIVKSDTEVISKLSAEESANIEMVFKDLLPSDINIHVKMEPGDEHNLPIHLMQPEFMRRMNDMSQMGGMDYMAAMGRSYSLIVNTNHPVIAGLADLSDTEKQKNTVSQLVDLALLSQGLLKGEKLSNFIHRSIDIIK